MMDTPMTYMDYLLEIGVFSLSSIGPNVSQTRLCSHQIVQAAWPLYRSPSGTSLKTQLK
jgi:hypothetical protein